MGRACLIFFVSSQSLAGPAQGGGSLKVNSASNGCKATGNRPGVKVEAEEGSLLFRSCILHRERRSKWVLYTLMVSYLESLPRGTNRLINLLRGILCVFPTSSHRDPEKDPLALRLGGRGEGHSWPNSWGQPGSQRTEFSHWGSTSPLRNSFLQSAFTKRGMAEYEGLNEKSDTSLSSWGHCLGVYVCIFLYNTL